MAWSRRSPVEVRASGSCAACAASRSCASSFCAIRAEQPRGRFRRDARGGLLLRAAEDPLLHRQLARRWRTGRPVRGVDALAVRAAQRVRHARVLGSVEPAHLLARLAAQRPVGQVVEVADRLG